jgi:hypothetical protein
MNMVGRATVVLLMAGCSKEYGVSSIAGAEPSVNPEDFMPCEFSDTVVEGMRVYDCNPVFEATTEDVWFEGAPESAKMKTGSVGFYTNLVLGFPVYQIWYVARLDWFGDGSGGKFDDDWGLGTAVSENGVDWVAHESNPLVTARAGRWDESGINTMHIARDDANDRYVLAYQGYITDGFNFEIGTGAAESADGVTWSFPEAAEPLMQGVPTSDDIYISWPSAIYANETGLITGYLSGSDLDEYGFQREELDLYAAELSEDLASWTVYDEPALRAGPEPYDVAAITTAAVVKLEDTLYMFYVGAETWGTLGAARTPQRTTLNLATSTTGISWTKHPGNPLAVDLGGRKELDSVAAQVVGDTIHLWVTDNYAASPTDPANVAVGYYLFKPGDDF